MRVTTARSAGFCFGVKRAVDMVYEHAGNGNVYTYGPVIHNEEVVNDLTRRGVKVLETPEDIKKAPKGTVIIRAHGVPEKIYHIIEESGHKLVDATCPFVLKIHQIVRKASAEGTHVIIVGDKNHPEVQGIKSCADNSTVIADESEACIFLENEAGHHKKLCVVAQTTYNFNKFQYLVEIFQKNSYDKIDVLNTICSATEERQKEAAAIAAESDAMIVIGSRNSSNACKLYDICRERCAHTYFIRTAADMDFEELKKFDRIGITAGASTPQNIIEEVQAKCQI